MKVYFPENIFTKVLFNSLIEEEQKKIKFQSSSLLSQSISQEENSIALIPTLDIITHPELHFSSSTGISFDASLCNSFIYYESGKEEIEKVNLSGDISSMDVLLLKIFLKEFYNSEPEIRLQPNLPDKTSENYFVSGDENFRKGRYKKGISFSEEMIELISAPYVNFILASKNKKLIEDYSAVLLTAIESLDYSNESHYSFDSASAAFIMKNMVSVVYDFTEQDIFGIKELVQLPYFHGYTKEIVDLQLV
jgi:hypothetical protein